MRTALVWMMIVGFAGIGVCDLHKGNYRLAAAGLMLAVVQWLIFGKG